MKIEKEILQLKQAVEKLTKEFANHADGDGVNPHQLATELGNGLMSADIYRQAKGYAYKDNVIKDKYGSLWNMPVGTYAMVYSFAEEVPVPDDMVAGDLITLRIIGEDNRRKTYFMICQKTGSVYYLNTSQNTGSGGGNNNSKLWKRLPQETILWNAGETNASVGQNVNLAVSTRRFRRLRFHIDGLGGTKFAIETPATDNPVINFVVPANSVQECYIVRIDMKMVRDNIVLKYERARIVTLYTSGEIKIDDTDKGFTILAVEGVY